MSISEQTFSQLPYVRPDLTALQSSLESISSKLDAAPDAEETLAAIRVWNSVRMQFSTMHSLAEVRYTQNVADASAKGEKEFFDAEYPTVTEWFTAVIKRILASPHRQAIIDTFGELFIKRLEAGDRTFDPSIKDLLVEETRLCTEYNDITASAKIDVDGTTYNLSSILKLQIDLNRETRLKAVRAQYDWLEQHSERIEAIFDRLVTLRTDRARALGYPSYTEFRYEEFGRVDYTANDVSVFRQAVIDHVVPLVTRFRQAQARRLGLDHIELHDERVQFVDGNPLAEGDHDWIVDKAQRMYADLSPETHEFFDLMLQRELLDLKTRENKATGGYCTSFPAYGVPFIFANFNKTTHDVEVLTHEAGHAFQAYRSRTYDVPEYLWPTAEACEIHSMGMEFLTWPWMDLFFGKQTDKFRFYHLQGALLFLPYGCAVDQFQHWVYANPSATPAERNAEWKRLEGLYMPWRDSTSVPHAARGTQWQFQKHIIEAPFYYIDYALAQTCALQYWQRSLEDRTQAFKDYLKICDIGGSQAFLEIVRSGNLKSPFELTTLADISAYATHWLERHYGHYL